MHKGVLVCGVRISANSMPCCVCLPRRVVWVFGGAVDGSIEVVTPTLLTRNVIRKLREADAKANAILKEMGRATADRMCSVSHIGQPPMHKCIAVCPYWQKFCVTLFCKFFQTI